MNEQTVSRRAAIAGAGTLAGLGLMAINHSTASAAKKGIASMQATPVPASTDMAGR